MNFGIPQIILIAFHLLGLGIALAKDGEPRDGKYSFWMSLLSTTIIF